MSQTDDDGIEYTIAFASRSCNNAERNYNSFHGECLAVFWAVQHFRQFLFGKPFALITDHAPFKWIMTPANFARWALLLQEYEFEVIHRPGVANSNADGCSRCQLPETATDSHEIKTLGEETSCYYMQTSPTGHIPPSYFFEFSPRCTTTKRCQSGHLG